MYVSALPPWAGTVTDAFSPRTAEPASSFAVGGAATVAETSLTLSVAEETSCSTMNSKPDMILIIVPPVPSFEVVRLTDLSVGLTATV